MPMLTMLKKEIGDNVPRRILARMTGLPSLVARLLFIGQRSVGPLVKKGNAGGILDKNLIPLISICS